MEVVTIDEVTPIANSSADMIAIWANSLGARVPTLARTSLSMIPVVVSVPSFYDLVRAIKNLRLYCGTTTKEAYLL
jgi:hypothetical protein